MKLLFENWRQFINEEVDPNATIRFEPTESPLEEANPELYRWLKKEKDIIENKLFHNLLHLV